MAESTDRFAALEEQIVALEERLAALEKRLPQEATALPFPQNFFMTATFPQGQRPSQGEHSVQGMLTYGGAVQFAGKPQQIQRQQLLAPLFEMSPEVLAQVFAALANPHRIIILRLLYQGSRTSQQLQEALGMSSAGQLYHHLKELLALGLIVQHSRSAYSLDPAKVITICVALMVAAHLTIPGRGQGPTPAQDASEQERT
jgi:ArsR family transcriptional regulator, arsenate/arsenite/antimonite-responsive transcriptional repressor